jgi:tyrosyl-DNA phosphodiesterase-1
MSSSPSPHKRRKVDAPCSRSPASLHRDVSPPPLGDNRGTTNLAVFDDASDPLKDFSRSVPGDTDAPREVIDLTADAPDAKDINGTGFNAGKPESLTVDSMTQTWSSPFRLTRIRDLPNSENEDTVGIEDILGDVMLREVWLFNYMHDISWVMEQLDEDIKDHVKVTFVHGNWKSEDESRKMMEVCFAKLLYVDCVDGRLAGDGKGPFKRQASGRLHARSFRNPPHKGHGSLPRRRHSTVCRSNYSLEIADACRIIIHTANMIRFDWTNMTQAAWISPLLPLAKDSDYPSAIGDKFKKDLLDYFSFYGKSRTGPLVDNLKKYSFSSVKAIFIGSVPGRHNVSEAKWGWPKLRRVLRTIPASSIAKTPKIFAQCSSIATLGANNTWLNPVFFSALSASATKESKKPNFGIIFPTAQEIRDSLNGYASGSSIHLRATSAAQQKQLTYLNPLFHHWSSSSLQTTGSSSAVATSAGRDLAAPHIKTYVRFAEDPKADAEIDWALITSANLSMQAWGAAEKDGAVRICSYEAGVLVHPGLWGENVKLKPVFLKDNRAERGGRVAPLRMPYGLPVRRYSGRDEAWCAAKSYKEVDWLGRSWKH